MYQSMMFQMLSLGIAIGPDPVVDLRGAWKKMTLLEGIDQPLDFPQRAIVTRGRISMLEGPARYFAFLNSVCQALPDTPWLREVSELLDQAELPAFIEDRAFIARYMKDATTL